MTTTIDYDGEIRSLQAEIGLITAIRDEHNRVFDTRTSKLRERLDEITVRMSGGDDAAALYVELKGIEAELNVVLADSDNVQQRNRKAIDLHGKLDRATAQVEDMRQQGLHVEHVGAKLTSLLDRLLKEVFNIEPRHDPLVKELAVAAKKATPAKRAPARKSAPKKAVAKKAPPRKS